MTSENHGTVGPAGCKFTHAPDKHERVQVIEIVAAGSPPAPGVDLSGLMRFGFCDINDDEFLERPDGAYFLAHQVEERITRAPAAKPVGEFKGYVDGQPAVTWFDRDNMPRVGTKLFAGNDAGEVEMDAGFLQWIHDRMRFVHSENENVDYMHKLRAIIASVPNSRKTPNVASAAAPSAPIGTSVDTPALNSLLATFTIVDQSPDASVEQYEKARAALIAHIDQHVASQVRAARAGQVAVPKGFVLIPEDAQTALIVAIEREVESQLDASGISRADMCRLDGAEIFDALVDAAMQASTPGEPKCTCPSGDGSLRWPCDVHPPAAQASTSGERQEGGAA
jgi:hypothetical protein